MNSFEKKPKIMHQLWSITFGSGLFYKFGAFCHLDNLRIINFAWSVFQNIGDFGRICPAEERLVIFFVEGAIC